METKDYKLEDLHRIFIGEVPGTFYFEVMIRTIIIFMILIIAIRLMGKRMASQLDANEMVAMVALAAAIGIPLQSPDRGIVPALIIAGVVVMVERGISHLSLKKPRFEEISQGNVAILVEDSVMDVEAMKHSGITHERLFEQIRLHGMDQLGQVKRLYMETGGAFTLVEADEPQPGLSVIPVYDKNYWQEKEILKDRISCKRCGFTEAADKGDQFHICKNCGHDQLENSVSAS